MDDTNNQDQNQSDSPLMGPGMDQGQPSGGNPLTDPNAAIPLSEQQANNQPPEATQVPEASPLINPTEDTQPMQEPATDIPQQIPMDNAPPMDMNQQNPMNDTQIPDTGNINNEGPAIDVNDMYAPSTNDELANAVQNPPPATTSEIPESTEIPLSDLPDSMNNTTQTPPEMPMASPEPINQPLSDPMAAMQTPQMPDMAQQAQNPMPNSLQQAMPNQTGPTTPKGKNLPLIALAVILAILNIIMVVAIVMKVQSSSASEPSTDTQMTATTYQECTEMTGSVIQESYPEVCVTETGDRFVNPDAKVIEPTATPTPDPFKFELFSECPEFIDNLKTCTASTCDFTHPLTGETMTREILGVNGDKCVYREEMPEDGEMSCNYSEESRLSVADYYEKITSGEEYSFSSSISILSDDGDDGVTQTETVDGEEIENPLSKSLASGECIVTGN